MSGLDDDPVVVDPERLEFEEWYRDLVRGMRRLCTFAVVVQLAGVVFVVREGLWANLPIMMVSLFMVCGSRCLLSNKGQAFLRILRDGGV